MNAEPDMFALPLSEYRRMQDEGIRLRAENALLKHSNERLKADNALLHVIMQSAKDEQLFREKVVR